jgi:ArsR family transcriptional regulator
MRIERGILVEIVRGYATQALTEQPLDVEAVFKALADPIRRSLVQLLQQDQYFCHVDGERVTGICVQDLSEVLKLPQSTVSRHLTILRQAGLVGHQQKGIWHYYFCRTETLRRTAEWLQALASQDGQETNK